MGRKINEIFLHGISLMRVRYFTVNHSWIHSKRFHRNLKINIVWPLTRRGWCISFYQLCSFANVFWNSRNKMIANTHCSTASAECTCELKCTRVFYVNICAVTSATLLFKTRWNVLFICCAKGIWELEGFSGDIVL